MTDNDLIQCKKWFSDYAKSYYSSCEEDQRNIGLKVEHTANVCRNIVEISRGAGMSGNEIRLAEAIGLFHDLGRFPQYEKYKTFRDADSVNHGLLGAKTLIKEKVLAALPGNEQQLIAEVVKFHNAFAIPTVLKGDTVLFLKLVRDADKVDIFRVFIEYYESPAEERASATAFGVPDTHEYSKTMLSCILNRQIASYAMIKTENDFKLMKLSWVYDMHFDDSLRILHERGFLERIMSKLPRTGEIQTAMTFVNQYISQRIKNSE